MQAHTPFLRLKAVAVALLLGASGQALAASGSVVGTVTRVLMVADATFGGCMAAVSPGPETALPGCQADWVTFSCSGDFTDPVRAYRMVDVAELALSTGKQVEVLVRDDLKHNGYCFADRIAVSR
jgi:hypothetical protein